MKILGCFLIVLITIASCSTRQHQPLITGVFITDSLRSMAYIQQGDSAYSARTDLNNIGNALMYYDSANAIATKLGDSILHAMVYTSIAGVYNAWNEAPQKTIEYYKLAGDMMSAQKKYPQFKIEIWYLLAHAYDKEKAGDSVACNAVLLQSYNVLKSLPDSSIKKMPFVSDFAWVATNNYDYALANSILDTICNRALIVNDPVSNNYLDHYYLTRARIDILGNGLKSSPYLDSLQAAYDKGSNNFDKAYYGNNLYNLYGKIGNYAKAYAMGAILDKERDQTKNGDTLLRSRLSDMEMQQKMSVATILNNKKENRNNIIILLAICLFVTSVFFIRSKISGKKYQQQSLITDKINEQLDEKINEVKLANKEMQHRLKNNLQMVFSLLQMQERSTVNEETVDNLKAARLRIESIASLHDMLSADELSGLNFSEYVNRIISNILNCFEANHQIVTRVNIADIRLDALKSFPLGLIINEWITNSIKYAKPEHRVLELNVTAVVKEGQLLLDYFDNGIVEPNKPAVAGGLGTQIVGMLCKQLKAELTITKNTPYHYHLKIPYSHAT